MPCVVINPAAQAFLPSGMNKNGTYDIPNSYTTVPTWTADTTGYPGSTVSSNGVLAQGGKSSATIAASCAVTNTSGIGTTGTLRLLVNGSVSVTGSPVSISGLGSGTLTVSGTATVASGDIVTVQATSADNTVLRITSGATSYVRIT